MTPRCTAAVASRVEQRELSTVTAIAVRVPHRTVKTDAGRRGRRRILDGATLSPFLSGPLRGSVHAPADSHIGKRASVRQA